jgi:hypothetical protein
MGREWDGSLSSHIHCKHISIELEASFSENHVPLKHNFVKTFISRSDWFHLEMGLGISRLEITLDALQVFHVGKAVGNGWMIDSHKQG